MKESVSKKRKHPLERHLRRAKKHILRQGGQKLYKEYRRTTKHAIQLHKVGKKQARHVARHLAGGGGLRTRSRQYDE